MKKTVWFAVVVLMGMLVFTACTGKTEHPDGTENTTTPTAATTPSVPAAATDPSAAPTTAPTAAPTAPTQPATEPTTDPYEHILTFRYHGMDPFVGVKPDVSECVVDHLYLFNKKTNQVVVICDSPIVTYNCDVNYIYFVKAAEPTIIYAAPYGEPTKHTQVYRSENGGISSLYFATKQYTNRALQFTVDNKQFVWLDLTTGESMVMMEQYYIMNATVDTTGPVYNKPVEKWQDYERIYFVGKLNEADKLTEYLYYRSTGKIEIWPYL